MLRLDGVKLIITRNKLLVVAFGIWCLISKKSINIGTVGQKNTVEHQKSKNSKVCQAIAESWKGIWNWNPPIP
jgi:hypothetical protein